MKRQQHALQILNKMKVGNYHYLGEGFSGIVYHDEQYVYKVHLPLAGSSYGESDGLAYLAEKLDLFRHSYYLYDIDLLKIDGITILKYVYDKAEPVGRISKEEYVEFLAECWKKRIVFKNIRKDTNFIRIRGKLKFIDYEILPYNDNLFLNSAARAYVDILYPDLCRM